MTPTNFLSTRFLPGPFLVLVGTAGGPRYEVMVGDLRMASEVVRAYIEEAGIGVSKWTGGPVFLDKEGPRECVAVVSYNGRIWAVSSQRGPEGQYLADRELEYALEG